jgi:hypothetical protein
MCLYELLLLRYLLREYTGNNSENTLRASELNRNEFKFAEAEKIRVMDRPLSSYNADPSFDLLRYGIDTIMFTRVLTPETA